MSDLVKKAVKFLTNKDVVGSVQMKLAFLKKKGLSDDEITESINAASGGVLLEVALGGG